MNGRSEWLANSLCFVRHPTDCARRVGVRLATRSAIVVVVIVVVVVVSVFVVVIVVVLLVRMFGV